MRASTYTSTDFGVHWYRESDHLTPEQYDIYINVF